MPTKINKVVWTYKNNTEFTVPETAIGFVYKIEVVGTPFYYFGKKNLTSTRGRGKNKIVKESNWKVYESSSKELKELIKSGKKIKKEILEFAYSKSQLTYLESKYILCENALVDKNSLNRWISCKIFQKNLLV